MQVVTRRQALNHKQTNKSLKELYRNNLPIISFICAENKYSQNTLKFKHSLHICHIPQKHIPVSQCLYLWFWGLAYFFCCFKIQRAITQCNCSGLYV